MQNPMRPLVILGAALALALFSGCTRQAWPEAVHEGVTLSVGFGDGGVTGKVLRVEPEWLSIESPRGPLLIPRERIVSVTLRPESP